MTWQLTLAACAAANLKPGLPANPSPTSPASVEWDASKKPTPFVLSNDNRDVENTGANNIGSVQMAVKPIRPGQGRVYFEVLVVAMGAASNTACVALISDIASFFVNDYPSQTKNPGLSYYSNGEIYLGNYRLTNSAPSWTTGDVIAFVVDAGEGKCWILKNNTVLNGGNLSTGVPTGLIRKNHNYYPAAMARDNSDKLRLGSIAAHFSYTPPVSAKPYGNDLVNFNYHKLPLQNLGFAFSDYYTNWSSNYWTVNPAGSTITAADFSGTTTFFDLHVNGGTDSFMIISGYNNSYPLFCWGPNQSGHTWGEVYQDMTFDSRFNDLIDDGQYALQASMFAGILIDPVSLVDYNVAFNVTFLDGSDAVISTALSPKLMTSRAFRIMKYYQRFIDVPAGTRKIRIGYRIYKPSAQTSDSGARRLRTACQQAALVRKMPLLRVEHIGSICVIVTP